MPQQLSINSGAQDGLLFDNSRSYFQNTGYTRTSNFQVEYRDIDPQNAPSRELGTKVQWVIPRTGDLLGNVDLMLTLLGGQPTMSSGNGDNAWCDAVGYAMMDKIEFSVGTNKVFETTGEALYIENEAMRDKDFRYSDIVLSGTIDKRWSYQHTGTKTTSHQLIVPLSLFFSKHPSQFMPLAALASCNDIRIAITFKKATDLIMARVDGDFDSATNITNALGTTAGLDTGSMKLRCHYVHVTGQEAEALVSQEHVRLVREVQSQTRELFDVTSANEETKTFTLSFLHPVSELIFFIRRADDLTSTTARNYFAFEGAPITNGVIANNGSCTRTGDASANVDFNSEDSTGGEDNKGLELIEWKLTLNGQDRHSETIGRDYTVRRLLPLHHSEGTNANTYPEVYCIPFALNPEGLNPSGSLNFSKVSNCKLTIKVKGGSAHSSTQSYQLDILAYNYNWLQIKDGRALMSFS